MTSSRMVRLRCSFFRAASNEASLSRRLAPESWARPRPSRSSPRSATRRIGLDGHRVNSSRRGRGENAPSLSRSIERGRIREIGGQHPAAARRRGLRPRPAAVPRSPARRSSRTRSSYASGRPAAQRRGQHRLPAAEREHVLRRRAGPGRPPSRPGLRPGRTVRGPRPPGGPPACPWPGRRPRPARRPAPSPSPAAGCRSRPAPPRTRGPPVRRRRRWPGRSAPPARAGRRCRRRPRRAVGRCARCSASRSRAALASGSTGSSSAAAAHVGAVDAGGGEHQAGPGADDRGRAAPGHASARSRR